MYKWTNQNKLIQILKIIIILNQLQKAIISGRNPYYYSRKNIHEIFNILNIQFSLIN